MKKETLEIHDKIANDTLYYIYTHIDTDIRIEELAKDQGISRFHLQRVFKEVFGRNIYETIRSIRLEKAANLLIVNTHSTISEIAAQCGYSSQGSFLKAFKARFSMTPKAWRRGGYLEYSRFLLGPRRLDDELHRRFEAIEYRIEKRPKTRAYYIRHRGYDAGIRDAWQRLRLFRLTHDIGEGEEIALYHDNPAIKALNDCAYVACLATRQEVGDARLPHFDIAEGVYARFDFRGSPGEEIALMHWIYHEWLPRQGFETTPKPSFALYRSNHFLSEPLDLSYFVSVTF